MEKVRRHQHAFTQRVALYTVPLAALWVPPAQAQVSFELLHPFVHQSQTEGWSPNALVQGTDGNFYGTNAGGSGADPSGLGGTAYMMRPDGTLVVLHAFGESPADGQEPGDLLQASDGNLYGLTYLGGMFNRGIVFRLTPTGGFTALHHFGEGADGAYPRSPLIQADDGLLYGTTEFGGMSGVGRFFA